MLGQWRIRYGGTDYHDGGDSAVLRAALYAGVLLTFGQMPAWPLLWMKGLNNGYAKEIWGPPH